MLFLKIKSVCYKRNLMNRRTRLDIPRASVFQQILHLLWYLMPVSFQLQSNRTCSPKTIWELLRKYLYALRTYFGVSICMQEFVWTGEKMTFMDNRKVLNFSSKFFLLFSLTTNIWSLNSIARGFSHLGYRVKVRRSVVMETDSLCTRCAYTLRMYTGFKHLMARKENNSSKIVYWVLDDYGN